jgi:hypothetical protein
MRPLHELWSACLAISGFGVTAALMLAIAIVAIRVAKWLGAGADPHVPEEATASLGTQGGGELGAVASGRETHSNDPISDFGTGAS